jgi:hypothetical protein
VSGAIVRLGHVLGWIGNGIAALLILGAVGVGGYSFWTVHKTNNLPTIYEVEVQGSGIWEVLAPKGSAGQEEAVAAAKKKAQGQEIPAGWIIYRQGQVPIERLDIWWEAKRRWGVSAKEATRATAWDQLKFLGTGCIVLAFLALMAGRAFRYVLSGPKIN